MKKIYSSGQAFVEVIITLGLVLVVLSVLTAGTVSGLRSSTFSSQKSQATTLAREGLELARKQRDQSWGEFKDKAASSELPNSYQNWCVNKAGVWSQGPNCTVNIDEVFTRTIGLQYVPSGDYVVVVSTVTWQEGGNTRQSKVESRLTNWQ